MDPAKNIGQMKEQIKLENTARRNYGKKWGSFADASMYKFYKPDEVNGILKSECKLRDLCPYQYTGKGECVFVSPEMYKSLLGTCRCGRAREDSHFMKCLQKEEDKYLKSIVLDQSKCQQSMKVPETSNAVIGRQTQQQTKYRRWEQSMKYISPVHTMPGPRITATPYNVIFIG